LGEIVIAQERRTVVFSGSVQGVGFRYTTCSIAGQYVVTGHVRNCPDGTVELVVEGQRDEIDTFIKNIAERMEHYISDVSQNRAAATGGFQGFGVQY
jgi:acylphosphatase